MDNILTAVSVIGAVVLGATGLVKKTSMDNKYLPYINVAVGIVLGLVYAMTIVKGDYAVYGWAGFIAGLSAGGFYDGAIGTFKTKDTQ